MSCTPTPGADATSAPVTNTSEFRQARATEARARRAARKCGLLARKSRWRLGTFDNRGGMMLIDVDTNVIVAGMRFDMPPEQVIEYCSSRCG